MIRCGWCHGPTANVDRCSSCGHVDPERPWLQRGEAVPHIGSDAVGRPSLDPSAIARRLADARHALGDNATVQQLAEHLDVDPKTVRRWRALTGVR